MGMNKTNTGAGFICRSHINPALILCTDGDWHPEMQMGPGSWRAKVYKTEAGAAKVRGGAVIVERIAR